MNKFIVILSVLAITFSSSFSLAKGSFGGSRGSGSSFGGSRSSGSSFGGSRSSGGSSTSKSSGSSFGGSRSTKSAPIVRPTQTSSPSSGPTSTTHVYSNYSTYGGGYYGSPYYGGGSFIHGYMWGQFFSRPQVIYMNGNSYVQGANGQPMIDSAGQPIVYEKPSAFGTAFAILVWLVIIGLFIASCVYLYRRFNYE